MRLFCCIVTVSDHVHILLTGVFEGDDFNKKFQVSEINGSRDIRIQNQRILIDVMLKVFCFFHYQNQFCSESLS